MVPLTPPPPPSSKDIGAGGVAFGLLSLLCTPATSSTSARARLIATTVSSSAADGVQKCVQSNPMRLICAVLLARCWSYARQLARMLDTMATPLRRSAAAVAMTVAARP